MKRLIKDLLLIAAGAYGYKKLIVFGYSVSIKKLGEDEEIRDRFKKLANLTYRINPEEVLKIFREVVSENMKEEKDDAGEN